MSDQTWATAQGMQRPMNTVSPHTHPPAVGSPGMVPSPGGGPGGPGPGQQQPRLGSPQPMMGPPMMRPPSAGGKELRMQRMPMRPPGGVGPVQGGPIGGVSPGPGPGGVGPGQPQPGPQQFRMRPPGSPVTYPGGSPAHQTQFGGTAMSPMGRPPSIGSPATDGRSGLQLNFIVGFVFCPQAALAS